MADYDRNTPSASMKKAGFDVGVPWIAAAPASDSGNTAACSTSWYTPAGTSDDWLVTPPVTLRGDTPELSFRTMASDKNHRDGFAVYVSTEETGDKTTFDLDKPLLAVGQEEAEWTDHTVSLAEYAGKTVRVAFVNNSTDCSRLYLDDISVYESHTARLALTTPETVNYAGEVEVSGTVSTGRAEPVKGFTVSLTTGGETFTQTFSDEVTAGNPVAFTLDRKLRVAKLQKTEYTVAVTADGDTDSRTASVTSYPRKAVCEEGTATWCSWCVRGLVALDSIRRNYSDRIVGIAVHSGDVMSSDYYSAVSRYFGSSLPTGTVNRQVSSDPKDFIRYASILLQGSETFCAMNLSLDFDRATRTVTAAATTTFAEDQAQHSYALAYAIIENAVHQPGNDSYNQHNAYADGAHGAMGGYENYGEYVPADKMWFNDVARGCVGDLLGIDGSIPQAVQGGAPVVDERVFTLPDNILADDNVEIVAMLIDKSDGHIVNAESAALCPQETGIRNGVADNSGAAPTAIYSIGGMSLKFPTKGINIIRLSNGKTVKVAQ